MNLPTSSRPTWRGRVMALVAWAAFIALGVLAITRASFESDFSAFLPRDPTPEQRLLVEQLRDGAASKLVLVALEGADAATRAQWSSRLAERLRREESTAFAAVENGAHDGAGDRYARLFEHRYLLSPSVDATRFTVDGLRAAINDTIALLGSPAGALIKPVILRDPTGEIIELASTFAARAEQGPRMQHGVWSSRDGQRALLLATTHAPGSDIDAQQAALARLHAHFDAVTRESPAPAGTAAGRLVATGPGVFAVLARERIKNDASRLSVIGSVLVAVILLAAFRSVPALILGAVPVATGVVAGIAAVALGFGTVYGLTVGFGITLIGEAIDYGIYFLVQSRGDDARTWFARFWPTVRLGLMTSLCGFAVLLLSGFPGLAQLGLFSCAGLIAAAWATRYVLPHLTPERLRLRASPRFARAADALVEHAPRTRWIAAALVLAAVAVIAYRYDGLWSRDLASLSPVSAAEQALDAQLRGDLGAPDVRHIIVIDAPDDEAALETAEHVGARLDAFVARGALAGYDSPARWLPSAHTQLARRDALPEPTVLRDRLAQATADLPISATRLQPFVEDVARARAAAPLSRADEDGTPLAAALDALLMRRGDSGSTALIALHPPVVNGVAGEIDARAVAEAVRGAGPAKARALDIKAEADRLYAEYLREAGVLALAGALATVAVLAAALRSPHRLGRVCAPLAGAVVLTLGALAMVGRPLGILHLIGLLLIVAVGSNYALFFDGLATRGGNAENGLGTRLSLLTANLTTVSGFGVLAWSDTPALHAIGVTVGPGALFAFVLSAAWIAPTRKSWGQA